MREVKPYELSQHANQMGKTLKKYIFNRVMPVYEKNSTKDLCPHLIG